MPSFSPLRCAAAALRKTVLVGTLASFSFASTATALEVEFEGEIETEARIFFERGDRPEGRKHYGSIASLIELGVYDESGTHSFEFKGFARGDSGDGRRSHGDIREAKYRFVDGDLEIVMGIDKVFWGVTEFVHLVDVINQTDLVESLDGEQKLGQAMLRGSYVSDNGTFSAFYMPSFRPRRFEGPAGRPGGAVVIDPHQHLYESHLAKQQGEYAVRYTNSIDIWDVGLSYFDGTARDPVLSPAYMSNGRFVPYYPLRKQVSLDVQATIDAWLLKLEALSQDQLGERDARVVTGVEYTLYSLFGSTSDLGLVAEYMWDERGDQAPQPFANDLGFGLRWVANDTVSTTLLAGAIIDLEDQSTALSIEAERRLNNNMKIMLEVRAQTHIDPDNLIQTAVKREDFARLRWVYYF